MVGQKTNETSTSTKSKMKDEGQKETKETRETKKTESSGKSQNKGGNGVSGMSQGNQSARGKGPSSKRSSSKSSKTSKKLVSGSKTSSKKNKSKTSQRGGEVKDRYFKIVDAKTGESHGRYVGKTPKQAGSKAYTKIKNKYKQSGGKIPKSTTLFLRESTRGKAKKIYGYTASSIKLDKPQKLTITDKITGEPKTIVYRFRNKIKRFPVPEQLGGLVKKSSSKGKAKTSSKKSRSTSSKTSKRASGSKASKKTKSSGKTN